MGDQRKGNWQLVMKQQPQAKQKLTDADLEQKMTDALKRINNDMQLKSRLQSNLDEELSAAGKSASAGLKAALLQNSALRNVPNEKIGKMSLVIAVKLWNELGSLDDKEKERIIREMYGRPLKSKPSIYKEVSQSVELAINKPPQKKQTPPEEKQEPRIEVAQKKKEPQKPQLPEEKRESPVADLLKYFESLAKDQSGAAKREEETGGQITQQEKARTPKVLAEEKKFNFQAFAMKEFGDAGPAAKQEGETGAEISGGNKERKRKALALEERTSKGAFTVSVMKGDDSVVAKRETELGSEVTEGKKERKRVKLVEEEEVRREPEIRVLTQEEKDEIARREEQRKFEVGWRNKTKKKSE